MSHKINIVFEEDSLLIYNGISMDSERILHWIVKGFSKDSALSKESQRIFKGFSKDSQRILKGVAKGSRRVLAGV